MSGDSYNKRCIVEKDTATHVSNFIRYENFKTACYQGWVHIPWHEHNIQGIGNVCLIERELKFLVNKKGRVDHQSVGSIQTNDMADCVSVVVSDLLGDQLAALDNGVLAMVVGAAQGGYTDMQDMLMDNSVKQQIDSARSKYDEVFNGTSNFGSSGFSNY